MEIVFGIMVILAVGSYFGLGDKVKYGFKAYIGAEED
tara:strand:- start:2223 stop:2333 length:111 start_codon:yes stop_codon:yes gene_type:complete